MAVESAQIVESHAGTPQIIQKVDNSLIATSGGATMGKAPGVVTSDPNSGLPAFLVASISWNSTAFLQAIFITLGLSMVTFCAFLCLWRVYHCWRGCSRSMEILPMVREGVFLGNILMELLYAVLISLRDSSLDSLSEERLLEWRGVV